MGLFGGSSSKQASKVAYGETANYGEGPANTISGAIDSTLANTVIYGSGNASSLSNVSRSTLTFNQSDYGAIEQGVGLAKLALETNGGAFREAIERVSENASAIVSKTLGIAEKTQVSESSRFQDTLLKLALVIAAGMAAVAFLKRGG